MNFIPDDINVEYAFFSNPQRMNFWKDIANGKKVKMIVTSNIPEVCNGIKVNYSSLLTRGWKYYDNAMIMCLKLMDEIGVSDMYFAGFDGYSNSDMNYYNFAVEASKSLTEKNYLNYELKNMLSDFKKNMKKRRKLSFVTKSKFEGVVM